VVAFGSDSSNRSSGFWPSHFYSCSSGSYFLSWIVADRYPGPVPLHGRHTYFWAAGFFVLGGSDRGAEGSDTDLVEDRLRRGGS
jgi:hypothetical protein